MAVWALGLNHNTAPLDLRGRFAFAVDQMGGALATLREALEGQNEATILSTCNRTETIVLAPKSRSPKPCNGLPAKAT